MTRSAFLLLFLALTTAAWGAVPVTDRPQQMVFSHAAVQAAAVTAYDKVLDRFAAHGQLDNDPALLERVTTISGRLIAQAIRLKPAAANWPWEIHTTSADTVDAYAMAGGKLLVGTRFVTVNRFTDGELTVLLAHEIAHVIAEHVREQVSLAATFDPPPPHRHLEVQDVINDMDSDISVYFRLQPLSRLQELEADDIGIELAARAGTPPQAIDAFYRKISSDAGGQSIFDTHGSPIQREAFVKNMLGYAAVEYRTDGAGQPPVYIFR